MGSDYEESDDEDFHKILKMNKETVDVLIRKRIAKHKNKKMNDDSDEEIDPNAFNPIAFIIE